MARGRKPTPADLQRLRGNPSHRRLRLLPRGASSNIEPPGWLKGRALAEWRRISPELVRAGVISDLDVGTLAAYCTALALIPRATQLDDGRLLIKALLEVRSYARELGLSPAARGHVLPVGPEEGGAESLLD